MRISSIRLGHATNSSSSHSVVFSPEPGRYHDRASYHSEYQYGWEYFVLASVEEKLKYLATCVYPRVKDVVGEGMALTVMNELFPIEITSEIDEGWVDHESVIGVPGKGKELFRNIRQVIEAFSDNRVTIFGGNDNSDNSHEPLPDEVVFGSESFTIRRDGNNYVVYRPQTGAKIRLEGPEPYTKSYVPELVDVKITDYCPYGCSFCYQGSTPDGYDSAESNAVNVIRALGILGVFEVALGGGEPPMSSYFTSVIEECAKANITANFTCFGTEWLLDPKRVEAAKMCKGIGVSIHSRRELNKVRKIKEVVGDEVSVIAQHVMGTIPPEEFIQLLSGCAGGWNERIPIILLGYKNVGFGGNFSPHDLRQALRTVLQIYKDNLRLSVDTAFVEEFRDILEEFAVSPTLIASPEGKFSCYIDAVKMRIAPSSYCEEDLYRGLKTPTWDTEHLAKEILDEFSKF